MILREEIGIDRDDCTCQEKMKLFYLVYRVGRLVWRVMIVSAYCLRFSLIFRAYGGLFQLFRSTRIDFLPVELGPAGQMAPETDCLA
jgi:hypothetical protein